MSNTVPKFCSLFPNKNSVKSSSSRKSSIVDWFDEIFFRWDQIFRFSTLTALWKLRKISLTYQFFREIVFRGKKPNVSFQIMPYFTSLTVLRFSTLRSHLEKYFVNSLLSRKFLKEIKLVFLQQIFREMKSTSHYFRMLLCQTLFHCILCPNTILYL